MKPRFAQRLTTQLGRRLQQWGVALEAWGKEEEKRPSVNLPPVEGEVPAHWRALLESSELPLQWFGRTATEIILPPSPTPEQTPSPAPISPSTKSSAEYTPPLRPACPVVQFSPTPNKVNAPPQSDPLTETIKAIPTVQFTKRPPSAIAENLYPSAPLPNVPSADWPAPSITPPPILPNYPPSSRPDLIPPPYSADAPSPHPNQIDFPDPPPAQSRQLPNYTVRSSEKPSSRLPNDASAPLPHAPVEFEENDDFSPSPPLPRYDAKNQPHRPSDLSYSDSADLNRPSASPQFADWPPSIPPAPLPPLEKPREDRWPSLPEKIDSAEPIPYSRSDSHWERSRREQNGGRS